MVANFGCNTIGNGAGNSRHAMALRPGQDFTVHRYHMTRHHDHRTNEVSKDGSS